VRRARVKVGPLDYNNLINADKRIATGGHPTAAAAVTQLIKVSQLTRPPEDRSINNSKFKFK
jgi:hypothetical protein